MKRIETICNACNGAETEANPRTDSIAAMFPLVQMLNGLISFDIREPWIANNPSRGAAYGGAGATRTLWLNNDDVRGAHIPPYGRSIAHNGGCATETAPTFGSHGQMNLNVADTEMKRFVTVWKQGHANIWFVGRLCESADHLKTAPTHRVGLQRAASVFARGCLTVRGTGDTEMKRFVMICNACDGVGLGTSSVTIRCYEVTMFGSV